jgi:hypothetical protein
MTDATKLIAGLLLITVPTIEFGGTFLLSIVSGKHPELTEFQRSMFRAGHAHAGVLVILAARCAGVHRSRGFLHAKWMGGTDGLRGCSHSDKHRLFRRGDRQGRDSAGRADCPAVDGRGFAGRKCDHLGNRPDPIERLNRMTTRSNNYGKNVEWMEKITDQEYKSAPQ